MSAGPSRSQISCRRCGSWQLAKPLDSAVNSTPAFTHCRLAHSCPFTHSLNSVTRWCAGLGVSLVVAGGVHDGVGDQADVGGVQTGQCIAEVDWEPLGKAGGDPEQLGFAARAG